MHQSELGNASLRLMGPGYEEPAVYEVEFHRLPEFPVAAPLLR